MEAKLSDKRVFGTMNGLRGIAALVVVAIHWSLGDALGLKYGFLAVDLFFVLSGFVIAYSYEERLKSDLSTGQFFLIRLIRLYPLYFLGTFFSVTAIFLSFLTKGRIIDTNLYAFYSIPFAVLMAPTPVMDSDWTHTSLYPLNLPAWSLFFEIVVNIIYAASVRFWTPFKLSLLMLSVASLLMLNLIFTGELYGDGGYYWSSFHLGLLRVFYSFAAGVLIYRLWKSGFAFPSTPSPLIIMAFVVLAALPTPMTVPFSVLVGLPILVAFAAGSEPHRAYSVFFKSAGAASYAIYAMHEPLHGFVFATLKKVGLLPEPLLIDSLLIVVIVPFSLLVDRVYDSPLRNALTRRLVHQKPSRKQQIL